MNFTEKKYLFSNSKEISIVNFYVNWCFYSKIQKLILNKFQQLKSEKVKVYNIDSDKNKKLVQKYNICTFPSILIFKNRSVMEHLPGLQDNDTLSGIINKLKLSHGLN